MRKMALVIGILVLTLTWGIILAQENPQKPAGQPEQTKKPGGPKGSPEIRPEMMGNVLEQGVIMQNPKVLEEMKRHREAMAKLLEQARILREKMKSKGEGSKGSTEGASKNPDNPENPEKPEMNPSAPPPSLPEGGKPEETKKPAEGFKSETEKVAGEIVAEIITHHNNLAQIVEAEKEGIQKKTAEFIASPKMPMRPEGMGGGDMRHKNEGQTQPPKPPKPTEPENKPE